VDCGDDGDGFLFFTEEGHTVPGWRMSLKEARRRSIEERERTEARFRSAPFPLYGLPPSWTGSRFLGGGWWGGPPGRERTKSLSLVHGTLVQGEGPILSVETGSDFSIGGSVLLSVAGMVWEGRSASVADAVAQQTRADPNPDALARLPARTELEFNVDTVRNSFDAFVDGDEWVARAEIGTHFVTVEGHSFDPADVALVHVTDIEPYILGTRWFHERR
jgi:hypothetical protein